MSDEKPVSEEMQGAFVDGQLDGEEWAGIAARLEADAALREEVCRLRAQKDLVRHAYAVPPARTGRAPRSSGPGWKWFAAASVAFAFAGWFGHAAWDRPPMLDAASAYALRGDWHALRQDWRSLQGGKVLVHVSSAGRDSLSAALDEVEDLLRESGAARRGLEVEIVANGPGLDLLRATDETFAHRLADLRRDYPGLTLVACGQTLERRRAEGHPVQLVPGTVVAPSALHQVVERLRAGWIYVRA